MRGKNTSFINWGLPVITVLSFLFVWQILVMYGFISAKTLSTPLQVFETLIAKFSDTSPDGATLQQHILQSLKIALSGLILGILVGTPLGLLMGWYKTVDRLVKPIFELIRPIPPIAWIPLTILWVGVGDFAKICIIFLSAFIPCVLNSQAGIRQTAPVLINMSKTFGASNFEIFYSIGVPSAIPMIFAGIRIALGNAWSTLVAAELLAANMGLGYMITMGRQFQRIDIIITGMMTIGLLGFIITTIFGKIEKSMMKGRV
ncbi:ABC transporter permease [Candidatus Epulonipiscium fishelsonii]|uniref:ABC transporter permease n=1 Tax=Candidatus Epulonipiscium fishelsonii TaxID=77094 RepID=A0ACC8XAX4_9FIRM|nr:ABC transporter permease [Epulopiscium sp. SCG-B11WGA-EpuloA1]ONI41207.1 ABC transporter permease [Epulopiscium sp. SCG-B05WGA-EpuloA1]ONI47354.1 ABC transporter permease [Epulopiscium sp. SCG-C06WGA-EpuloA1]